MPDDARQITAVEEDVLKQTSAEELIARSDLTHDDVERADEIAKQRLKGRALVALTEYQKLIVTAVRKFIAVMICRQGGKTFASTLRIARKVLETRMPYYILSRSERQSGNAIAQLVVHLRAIEKALRAKGKKIGASLACASQRLRYTHADGSELQYTRLTVGVPNGSKVVGLPSTPDTVVGVTGSVYGDEFATHRNQREVYGRLFPIISRRAEYEMVLTSTPRGISGKWYEIMTSKDFEEIFLRVTVDIFKAVQQGLVLYDYKGEAITNDAGIERLRQALKDPDMWYEEYLCKFIDDALNLLTYEMIARCERLHDVDGKPYEIVELEEGFDPARDNLAKAIEAKCHGGSLYLGFDQARRRNLSEIWVDEELNGELWQRARLSMFNKDYEYQEAVLWQVMSMQKLRRGGIDATGLGGRTAERTVTRFGSKAVAIDFNSTLLDRNGTKHPVKSLLARVIMERHQDCTDHYPVDDDIRDDLHKPKRKRGANPDQFTYFADDDETGHADIFTAKALCDVVFQELKEYAGRADGMRIAPEKDPEADGKLRPDHSSDHFKPAEEFAGIGSTF